MSAFDRKPRGTLMSWLQGIRREQSGMIERRANNQDRGSQPVAGAGPMHIGVQQAASHRLDAQPYPPRSRRYPSHRAIPARTQRRRLSGRRS